MNATPCSTIQEQLLLCIWRDVFVGEINVRFDMSQRLHHFVAKLVDALGKFASELFVGRAQCEFSPRMNQIRDGFRLGEVNSAIQEGAPREFARFGEPRAAFKTVSRTIFAGRIPPWQVISTTSSRVNVRGARITETSASSMVTPSRITFAVMNCVCRGGGWLCGRLADRQKTSVCHSQRLRSGDANHRQTTFSNRRGNRCNGIVEEHLRLQDS